MKRIGLRLSTLAFIAVVGDLPSINGRSMTLPAFALYGPEEETSEEAAEQAAEEAAEQAAEEAAEQAAEEAAEQAAEEAAEQAAEEAAEQAAEEAAEQAAEEAAEQAAEEAAEQAAEEAAEQASEEAAGLQEEAADEIERASRALRESDESAADAKGESPDTDGNQSKEELAKRSAQSDPRWRALEVGIDEFGDELVLGERLLLLSEEGVATLATLGIVPFEITPLAGLGGALVRLDSSSGFKRDGMPADGVFEIDTWELDFNHLYMLQQSMDAGEPSSSATPPSFFVRAANLAEDHPSIEKIGLIDTHVETRHASLTNSLILTADFVDAGDARPNSHGTSVASVLVGQDGAFTGLLPGAELYAAAVFTEHPSLGAVASVSSLVQAIDWMTLNGVTVVNMSLAGPPNRVLEAALQRAVGKGMIIVAAAGNQGPATRPRYPAAYESVIAVTAVNMKHRVYPLAVRGSHIDFAAPGVNVLTADAAGNYVGASGTSIAAPFVTAAVALYCGKVKNCGDHDLLVEALAVGAIDLGSPGHDPIYGHGLITP